MMDAYKKVRQYPMSSGVQILSIVLRTFDDTVNSFAHI